MARYLIVGGVAGGASTAARLRRLDEHAEIVLFERGDYVSYANCGLPYYVGGVIAERERLFVMTPEKFRTWLAVDVRTGVEALAIDRAAKRLKVRDIRTGAVHDEPYDKLILSPGAEPIKPPIPGVELPGIFTFRSVPDADALKAFVDERRPERAVVVGGGFIGLELAENLRERGIFVTIVEALDQVMGPLDFEMAAIVHSQLKQKGVELYLGDGVAAFERKGPRILARLSSGAELDADLVVLAIGVRPDTGLARAADLTLTKNGAIVVDEHLCTSDPSIYALGDAVEFASPILGKPLTIPLAGPANKQARVVADHIVLGGAATRRWQGSIGTSIAKVFDLVAAATGLSEKVLAREGLPHAAVVTHGSSHAGYYPGALPLSVKIIYDPASGRLLGGQVVGFEGVDKRIDLIASVIRHGGTVFELGELEHAYAPPFSSAKDPVNIAGFAAENAIRGLSRPISWKEAEALRAQGAFFLDVRSAEEFALGTIPGAVNIPHTEIRSRLAELPRDRSIVVFCGVGLRGYLAERVLAQAGFGDVHNLSGGYKTWELALEPQDNRGIYRPGIGASIQSALASAKGAAETLLHETFAEGSGLPEHLAHRRETLVRVDACGLQCPGPIMRLKAEADKLPEGGRIAISATDPGFARDVKSWCAVTNNLLVSLEESKGVYTALVEKTSGQAKFLAAKGGEGRLPLQAKGATLIVFSDDMDKALASFVLANGAAASGKDVTMFFTFWGLSVVKRPERVHARKDLMGRLFGLMLPRHAGKLSLSKMNFAGMGPLMMKARMKAKRVDALETMIAEAKAAGVRLVACQMSMDIMGVAREELMDGVEIGGVATYMEAAGAAGVNLFI